ncbi:Auxin-induced protein 5NG4 [Hibiscus syriacus]|uniref:WAT1-related protein n=1 Tax=Hibiscus syriacus TaxID=106335 RepID=A0A6A2XEA6_HIBSY|nr:WAT1-related protein At3g53210-like [Hibiscus syriacus]KAE8674013.1 Auxin-induced protein 5NG4 [Hibiscus syriacus]
MFSLIIYTILASSQLFTISPLPGFPSPMAEAVSGFASAARTCGVPERAKLHIAMNVFQLGYAVNHVIMRVALNMGVSKLVFPFYRNILALLALAPSAYFLEKKKRPALTVSFLIQFFLLGFIGITLNQGFYIFGLDNTSPALASATENSVPAVTFIMAALLRMEQVHLNRKDGIAKVFGTLASVAGALVITLYKGPIVYSPNSPSNKSLFSSFGDAQGKNWTIGCICLIGHSLCWSSWIVLQAPVLKEYPARLSFVSYTCFFAVMQFGAIAAAVEKDPLAWQVHSGSEVFTIVYTGLIASAMVFALQIYVVDRGGPLFVSMYLPLQTLLAAVLATVTLGEEFYLGGVVGAALIIAGLYLVILGKNEESKFLSENEPIHSMSECNGVESTFIKPLLEAPGT